MGSHHPQDLQVRALRQLGEALARNAELEQTWSAVMAQNARHLDRIADLEIQVADWKARATAPDDVSDNALDMARAFVRRWFGENTDKKQDYEDTAELARMFDAFQREAQAEVARLREALEYFRGRNFITREGGEIIDAALAEREEGA